MTIDRDALAQAIAETRCAQIFGRAIGNPGWDGLIDSTRDGYREVADEVLAKLPEPAVPYTDPRDGDEVEIVLRARVDGRTIAQPAAYCQPRGFFDGRHFADLIAAGCVTLVKAAAPQYQPGRIYRDQAGPRLFLRVADPDTPWMVIGSDGDPTYLPERSDHLPAGLVLCDVVPAQVSP